MHNNSKIIAKKGSLHNPNNKHKIENLTISILEMEKSSDL